MPKANLPATHFQNVFACPPESDDGADFRMRLLTWFDANKRDLPWRNTADPYHIWISEVMLQQTQVSRVREYYKRFLGRFPSLSALAAADFSEVLKMWEGLGYYSRARLLHRAAQRIVTDFSAELPNNFDTLRALPGFGSYTAAAVASIAFGQPVAAVDANVLRVLSRLHANNIQNVFSRQKAMVANFASRRLSSIRPGDFNQAMMELGAVVCTPHQPKCVECPVKIYCQAFKIGEPTRWPLKPAKRQRPTVRAACVVIKQGEAVLLAQRVHEKLLGNLWEFPWEALRENESPETGCRRFLHERFRANVASLERITRLERTFTHFKLELHTFSCNLTTFIFPEHMQWATPADIERLPLTSATQKLLEESRGSVSREKK